MFFCLLLTHSCILPDYSLFHSDLRCTCHSSVLSCTSWNLTTAVSEISPISRLNQLRADGHQGGVAKWMQYVCVRACMYVCLWIEGETEDILINILLFSVCYANVCSKAIQSLTACRASWNLFLKILSGLNQMQKLQT